jgi:hypothetical protein
MEKVGHHTIYCRAKVCGTCGSDTPHLLLKSCAFAHDIPGSGMPDAFHAKPAENEERENRIWEDLGNTLREMGEEEPPW